MKKLLRFLLIFIASAYGVENNNLKGLANEQICSEFSSLLTHTQKFKFSNPARKPTEKEMSLIDSSHIELLEYIDYAVGSSIVDIDNDGKEDVLVWNIQGSGRYVNGELLSIMSKKNAVPELHSKLSLNLGVLQDPHFSRLNQKNYLIKTLTGNEDGSVISQVSKTLDGHYQEEMICKMEPLLTVETACRHTACKELTKIIETQERNSEFINIVWPHKYFSPVGLDIYFPETQENIDFDNTHNPTNIWRFGREGYIYQYIYWSLLGIGEKEPQVEPKLRNESEDITDRQVLPDIQHDRLRRVMSEQSNVLSNVLNKMISLPKEGEFFLFKANGNRTYWAWDFGQPAYGEEIHILYTNAKKSDYIGTIKIKRTPMYTPCTEHCIESLD